MKEGVHVSLEAWRSIMVPSHSLTSSTPLVSVYHVPTPRSSLLPRSIPFASHLLHSPLSKPTNLSTGIHSSIPPLDSSNKPIHSSIQPIHSSIQPIYSSIQPIDSSNKPIH